jgi:predicted dehydrogenase
VLLEAFHYKFHPAWQTFLSILKTENKQADIKYAFSDLNAPKYMFNSQDNRFNYDLAGGACMDMGCYNISILRQIFGAEPVKCTSAIPRFGPAGWDPKCDQAMKATWEFPNGGTGEMDADLAKRFESLPIIPYSTIPRCMVRFKNEAVDETDAQPGETPTVKQRTITFFGTVMASHWHRIDISDEFEKKAPSGEVLKKWTETSSRKAYGWGDLLPDEGITRAGDDWWDTFRCQLEEFVNRVKGRPGSGVWVEPDESIKLMEMVDGVYEKAGLPLRPTSIYNWGSS